MLRQAHILTLLLLFALVPLVGAQESTPTFALPTPTPGAAETISANVPITVDLTGSGAVDLIYSGSSGEIISVTARSLEPDGVLDTTVEVLNAGGTRLAFNDDHGTARSNLASFDSFIGDLKLLSAGDFTIRVSTFSGAGAGQVEVLVMSDSGTSAPTVEPTSTESREPEGEEVITGVVPDNDRFTQSISVQPGDVLTVTVRATDNVLDPRVALIDPGGAVVAENDDHASDDMSLARFDSRISDFAIIDGGRYTIQITAFGGAGGSFELTIERTSGLDTTPTPTSETVETLQDSIGAGETFTHEFSARAGDVYVITASALEADFDPRLAVYDSANEEIFSNDDHGTSDAGIAPLDARIINLIMPSTGDYVVEVSGYQESAGEFELTLERVATGAPTGSGTDQVFTGDVRANGTFTETFEARVGDYVTITVRAVSEDFDPRLSLISPDGVIVADNDDHGTSAANIGFLDSRIHNYFITESGTYTIEVQGYRGSAGSFAVTVTTLR